MQGSSENSAGVLSALEAYVYHLKSKDAVASIDSALHDFVMQEINAVDLSLKVKSTAPQSKVTCCFYSIMTIYLFPELEDASTKIFIGYTGAAVTNPGHTFLTASHLFLRLNTLNSAKKFHQSVFTYKLFKRSCPQMTMLTAYFLNKIFLVF